MTTEFLKELIGIEEYSDWEETEANSFENFICAKLSKFGAIRRQVRVPNRGDGKSGRIDVVLNTDSETLAIEIDRNTPRQKSIFKTRSYSPENAFVVTRAPFTVHKF